MDDFPAAKCSPGQTQACGGIPGGGAAHEAVAGCVITPPGATSWAAPPPGMPPAARPHLRRLALVASLAPPDVRWVMAVSYTHLTLPTSDLV